MQHYSSCAHRSPVPGAHCSMSRVLRDREALGVSCVLLPVPRPESTASWNCARPSSASCVYTVFLHRVSDIHKLILRYVILLLRSTLGCMAACCRRATFKARPSLPICTAWVACRQKPALPWHRSTQSLRCQANSDLKPACAHALSYECQV